MTPPIVWLVLVSIMTAAAWGQAPPATHKFEVASIRRHTGQVHRVGESRPDRDLSWRR